MDLHSRKINLINMLLSVDNVQTIDKIENLFLENNPNISIDNQLEIQKEMIARAEISDSDIINGNVISHFELKRQILER